MSFLQSLSVQLLASAVNVALLAFAAVGRPAAAAVDQYHLPAPSSKPAACGGRIMGQRREIVS